MEDWKLLEKSQLRIKDNFETEVYRIKADMNGKEVEIKRWAPTTQVINSFGYGKPIPCKDCGKFKPVNSKYTDEAECEDCYKTPKLQVLEKLEKELKSQNSALEEHLKKIGTSKAKYDQEIKLLKEELERKKVTLVNWKLAKTAIEAKYRELEENLNQLIETTK